MFNVFGWQIILLLLTVGIGVCFGSLVNVIVYRWRAQISLWDRSRCHECAAVIRPRHLVPIISWLLLRGTCASCRRPIHVQYPLVEMAALVLTLITVLRFPWWLSFDNAAHFLFEFALCILLLTLVVFDLRWQLLPLEPIAAGAIVGAVSVHILLGRSWESIALGALVGWLCLYLQNVLTRGHGLGLGDVWLGVLIGVVTGWPLILFSFYVTYILAGLFYLPLWLLGRVRATTRVAFGPWLAVGLLLTVWYGDAVVAWIWR